MTVKLPEVVTPPSIYHLRSVWEVSMDVGMSGSIYRGVGARTVDSGVSGRAISRRPRRFVETDLGSLWRRLGFIARGADGDGCGYVRFNFIYGRGYGIT